MSESDGANLPEGTAAEALAEILAYEKEYQTWEQRGEAIVKRYRDERSEATNIRAVIRKFNVLWSNTETLRPTLYARLPRVQVERRFKDADPVGRTACEIAERAGNYLLETSPFDNVQRLCVQDLLLPGRGAQWINYRAEMSEVEQPMDSDDPKEDEEVKEPELEKVREMIEPIYVAWRDFGHSPKRTWQEVTKVWRITYMGRKQLVKRFGEKGESIPLDRKADDTKDKSPDSLNDTASVYELWDKKTRKVCWVHKNEKDYLDESDPPVDLQDFWPLPRPIWSTLTNDTLVPVPLFALYQDQAAELDKITNRIGRFTDGLKLAGVCDASVPELTRLLSPNGAADNMLIPVANFAALQEKGGINGAVQLLPLQDISSTLLQLYEAREQILNVIYQVTGIADIIRGATNPNETATAQSIKGQFASLRIKDTQAEVARFARDAARIMVEMAVELYEPETLYEMVQADQFTKLTAQEQQRAQTQAQFAQITRQPAPPPPKPMEEFQQALRMLRDDKMRSFHIDIETDSTIAMNEQEDKQNVTEFLAALGQFMQGFGPMIQEMPALAPVAGEALLYATRRYKAGRSLETAIEKAVAQIEQAATQPKPPPPEMLKIQAEQQAKQADLQRQKEKDAADIQTDRLKNDQDAQANQAKIAQDAEKAKTELQIKTAELALKERELELKERELHLKARDSENTAKATERSHQLEEAKAVSSGVTGVKNAPPHPLEKHLTNLAEQVTLSSKEHAQASKALAEGMGQFAKVMGAPRKLVKDAKTGEKRSELVVN